MTAIRPELLPTLDELMRLRAVAAGVESADVIVRGGRVLHVQTGEFLERDVVIAGRHIAAVTPVGRFEAPVVIDAAGSSVVPTFIDAHLHIEYTMLTPGELARLSVPRGTTTVLTDADCLANVSGLAGIEYMGQTTTPMRIFDQITPQTPISRELERGGAIIDNDVVLAKLAETSTVTLGESNPFDYSEEATNRFRVAQLNGKRITGHTARMYDEALWGYLAAGISDDHNAATADEAMERVRLGAMITIMSSSMNDNIEPILGDLDAIGPALGHMCFCADDKHALDLSGEGHIDHSVRSAIAIGVDVAQAYRMATWQPATYYHLDHLIGSIAPGRLADLQIIENLADVRPELVMVGGVVAARNGVALFENTDEVPDWTRGTMNVIPHFDPAQLAIRSDREVERVQAVEMYDGYFKRGFHIDLPVRDGAVQPDLERDVLKITVVDRHFGDGKSGVGFAKGFGLTAGAMATSANCTNMNIVAVGCSDEDIAFAVETLREMDGGFVAVKDGHVLAAVALPVGGLMSDKPWEQTAAELAVAHDAVAKLGCTIRSPFMILSFAAFIGVPDFGVSELGFVDIARQEFAPLVIDEQPDGRFACRCISHDHPVHRMAEQVALR
jgi:adenine deaminase